MERWVWANVSDWQEAHEKLRTRHVTYPLPIALACLDLVTCGRGRFPGSRDGALKLYGRFSRQPDSPYSPDNDVLRLAPKDSSHESRRVISVAAQGDSLPYRGCQARGLPRDIQHARFRSWKSRQPPSLRWMVPSLRWPLAAAVGGSQDAVHTAVLDGQLPEPQRLPTASIGCCSMAQAAISATTHGFWALA
jgi:hypothetical protein